MSKQSAMYFPESEVIAREHNDLRWVVELVDLQLATIFSSAPLRATDFAYIIECDTNQVDSVFDLLAGLGVLRSEAMVECERCQNLMSAAAFRQAIDDEDRFECSSCGHPYRRRTQPVLIYRMTSQALSQPKPELPEDETPAADEDEPLGQEQAKPVVDGDTFSVSYRGKSCQLRNTKEFALFERLNRRPGQYFSNDTLIQDVWGDALVERNTVQRTVSNLRQKLSEAGFEGIEIDGTTNRGHYALILAGR